MTWRSWTSRMTLIYMFFSHISHSLSLTHCQMRQKGPRGGMRTLCLRRMTGIGIGTNPRWSIVTTWPQQTRA
ncbi:hypothetical protein BXZ70DRAFT_960779 [Cristinia sonorae]|uniref:Secreted protein n=1 Tax=Cristinia sonorae TaxID=1940300 RepID=A0A8K0XK60_9AGAR|nr:hypothetical protein BXZ70DRAFT_960779 [Cristinia sonorae]